MAQSSLFARKPLLDETSQAEVLNAIRAAEKQTSGEVRVFVERRCRFVDPLDRAAEVFHDLKMEKTEARNGVLVYVAVKDRQLAVYADEGIFQKAGADFWNRSVAAMLHHFNKNDYGRGIAFMVSEVGSTLQTHFPYNGDTDKNELPDDIVFGK